MASADIVDRSPAPAQGVRRLVYWSLAGLCLALAVVGVLVPILPTTPFLLLTSVLVARVSPAWHQRLLRLKLVGPILQDWRQHRGVRRGTKIRALSFVVLAVAATIWLTSPPWSGLAALGLLAAIGIAVIVRLPKLRN